VLDCVYPLARDHLAFPELFPEYEPHQVREVYLIQWEQPSLLVDITDTMDVKLKSIACHASQVGDLKAVEARMRRRAAILGKTNGQMYADGFDHVLLPG
jgi:LmbE family N-acetylglucosaminyl deacetylase